MDQREQNLRLKEAFERGITYKTYSELLQQYARQGKTSGEQKESYVGYTKLAAARQRRWEKTYSPEVNFIDAIYDCKVKGEQWLVFTETWCGDAAHALPFFNEWAIATKIPMRIVFRDEHPELMDQFLTDGGRSIPKWIRLNDHFEAVSNWGPRPSELTDHYKQWKADTDFDKSEWSLFAQDWYNKNKGRALENDIFDLMR